MSRSYKMPFHKLAPDREWQKMAHRLADALGTTYRNLFW